MPFGIQPIHIVIIIVVAILIFGANKLPELGRSLGKSITEFRKGTKEAAEEFKQEVQNPDGTPPASNQNAFPNSAPAAQPTGNFCIQCGTPTPPAATFCNHCGAKLPEKVA